MTSFSKNAYDYKCSVPHCNKRFSCKYGLDYHSKHVHNQPISSEKKYICLFQYCEKRLTTYNGLIYHLKTAHGLQRGEFSKFFYVALN
ncbi:zinc finger protein [Tubulinosema ratisbonensis]|uniref:Zinc finger protein n=1 Tax=Tubulinosema ratisbonensis TaxID=291195 RepID=A0A437AM42_9MICR|nr:zinc finger protein [Tubulinosema ratisbonensis]